MAVKLSLGTLELPADLELFVSGHLAANAVRLMPIERDPFDRLLAAQALDEDLTLVSADPIFRRYGVKRVW